VLIGGDYNTEGHLELKMTNTQNYFATTSLCIPSYKCIYVFQLTEEYSLTPRSRSLVSTLQSNEGKSQKCLLCDSSLPEYL